MSPTVATAPSVDDALDTRAIAAPPAWRRIAATTAFWVLLVDIVLILFFGLASRDQVFLTVANGQNIALSAAEAMILAVGFALLMGAGMFDLSLGANVVLSSVVGAKIIAAITGAAPGVTDLQHETAAALLGLVACVAVGALVGAVNGIIVCFLRVNSLIATLGTMGVATGIAYVITNGGDVTVPVSLQQSFGLSTIAWVPLPAVVALIVALIAWLVLHFTRAGLRLLAIGSLRASAERAGLRVERFGFVLFTIVGAAVGLAGFIDIARFASTTVSGHQLDGLAAATAAVIGGTAIAGGRVSVTGAVLGALLAVVLQVGLVILGLQPFYQQIAVGVVLIVAVTVDQLRRTRREAG
jgi:ribose transport system permease protein